MLTLTTKFSETINVHQIYMFFVSIITSKLLILLILNHNGTFS